MATRRERIAGLIALHGVTWLHGRADRHVPAGVGDWGTPTYNVVTASTRVPSSIRGFDSLAELEAYLRDYEHHAWRHLVETGERMARSGDAGAADG